MPVPDCTFGAKNSGASLIASGTVVPLDDGPVDLEIPVNDPTEKTHETLVLRLSFLKDETDKSARFKVNQFPDKPTMLELQIVNMVAPLGAGPNKPINLWRSQQDTGAIVVTLNLRIQTLTNCPPTIHFSFYEKFEETPKISTPKAAEVTP